MNSPSLLEKLEIEHYEVVSGDDAIRLANNWLSAFCPSKTSFKDALRFKSYIWDVMNCDLEKEEAAEEYEKHNAPKYVIMEDCFGQDEKEIYFVDQKPKGNGSLQDFHVFPKNLAWTMAFTHEDGWIGPIFSKHKNFKKLNDKNSRAVQAIRRGYGYV